MIQRQLEARFGTLDATSLARLRAATIDELQNIASRLLTAPALGDVLPR